MARLRGNTGILLKWVSQCLSMPLKYWGDAFQTATYIINRLPTPTLSNNTPLETLFHQEPAYHAFRTFGSACYPYLRPYNKHKLNFKSEQCVFLGYNTVHKGYLCLSASGRIYISRHVTFDELCFPFKSNSKFSLPTAITLLILILLCSICPLFLLFHPLTILLLLCHMILLLLNLYLSLLACNSY